MKQTSKTLKKKVKESEQILEQVDFNSFIKNLITSAKNLGLPFIKTPDQYFYEARIQYTKENKGKKIDPHQSRNDIHLLAIENMKKDFNAKDQQECAIKQTINIEGGNAGKLQKFLYYFFINLPEKYQKLDRANIKFIQDFLETNTKEGYGNFIIFSLTDPSRMEEKDLATPIINLTKNNEPNIEIAEIRAQAIVKAALYYYIDLLKKRPKEKNSILGISAGYSKTEKINALQRLIAYLDNPCASTFENLHKITNPSAKFFKYNSIDILKNGKTQYLCDLVANIYYYDKNMRQKEFSSTIFPAYRVVT